MEKLPLEKIIALIGSKSKIIRKPMPSDDPKQRQPDTTPPWLAPDWAGHRPFPSDQGLPKTIAYFDNLLRTGITVTR